MRICIVLFVIILSGIKCVSQNLSIYIDSLEVYNLKRDISESDETLVMHENGPYIIMRIAIENKASETLVLNPENASYFLTFRLDGVKYTKELFPLAFMDYSEVDVNSGELLRFEVHDELFQGTPIYSVTKSDYYREMLKVLPTMNFIYKQRGLKKSTCEIRNVIIP